MGSPRVICVGEALFDGMVDAAAANSLELNRFPGGAPATVACALAKLGQPAAFVGCLGADASGEQFLGLLNQLGVDVTGVQRHATAPTRQVEVRLAGGDPQWVGFAGQQAPGSFADAQLQAAQLPESLFAGADYLILGSVALAYPDSAAAVARAVELANDYFVKIVLDVNWQPLLWADDRSARSQIEALAQRVDFLKLSDREAEWLYGTTDAATILAQLDQLEAVFVTAGEQGVRYAFAAGPQGHVPAFCMPVQDRTGAGDAFVAALVHQLLTHSLQQLQDESFIVAMLRYANAAGSLATTGWGAIAPQASDAEIQAFLVGRTV